MFCSFFFQFRSTSVKDCEVSEVTQDISLPSNLGKVVLRALCLGSPSLQHSPDRRAVSIHVWIYIALAAVTCQPPGAAFSRTDGTLLDWIDPLPHVSGHQWTIKSQTGQPLTSESLAGICVSPAKASPHHPLLS